MMSFGEALGFPFKAENLPKTLNLILIYVIITSSVMVLGLLANAIELALLISGIVSIGYSFFVSGYMIEVIRNVMDGNEILPPSDLGRDIKRGFAVFIASLVHMIPFIILFACALGAIGSSMNMGSMEFSRDMERLGNSGDGGAILMVCGLSIVALFAGFFVFNALLIGMVRYAAEDRAGAMFEFGTNLSYVTSNAGSLLGLFMRSFGIGFIYGILTSIVSGMFGTELQMMDAGYRNIGLGLMALFVVESVITQTLSLMSQFSVAHLQARLGNQLGISGRKSKHDDDYTF
jgi:hypothetical protein